MNEKDELLIAGIIRTSGKMWQESRDRSKPMSGVVICVDPERAWYLERVANYQGALGDFDGWIVEERPLRACDAADFYASFGNHWYYWLGAIISNAPLRAYIKNGRYESWTISLDVREEAKAEPDA